MTLLHQIRQYRHCATSNLFDRNKLHILVNNMRFLPLLSLAFISGALACGGGSVPSKEQQMVGRVTRYFFRSLMMPPYGEQQQPQMLQPAAGQGEPLVSSYGGPSHGLPSHGGPSYGGQGESLMILFQ